MGEAIKLSFRATLLTIPLVHILPLKKEPSVEERKQTKYRQIDSSVRLIGLVEPLVVFPSGPKNFLLVDGHIRLDVLRQIGVIEAECLLAIEDESYTYNRRTNYVPPISEHYMILKALGNGVTEERIAAVLAVDVPEIRRRRDLLNGICPEVAQLLKTKRITVNGCQLLRKMKPIRQIHCADLMISANTFTVSFIKAFVSVTPDELLVKAAPTDKRPTVSNHTKTLLEEEAEALVADLKKAEESYGADMLELATSCRYFARLLGNSRVKKYLGKYHRDILGEMDQLLIEVNQEVLAQASA